MFRNLIIAVITVVAALLGKMADAIAASPRDRSGSHGGPHIGGSPPVRQDTGRGPRDGRRFGK